MKPVYLTVRRFTRSISIGSAFLAFMACSRSEVTSSTLSGQILQVTTRDFLDMHNKDVDLKMRSLDLLRDLPLKDYLKYLVAIMPEQTLVINGVKIENLKAKLNQQLAENLGSAKGTVGDLLDRMKFSRHAYLSMTESDMAASLKFMTDFMNGARPMLRNDSLALDDAKPTTEENDAEKHTDADAVTNSEKKPSWICGAADQTGNWGFGGGGIVALGTLVHAHVAEPIEQNGWKTWATNIAKKITGRAAEVETAEAASHWVTRVNPVAAAAALGLNAMGGVGAISKNIATYAGKCD